MSTKIAASVTIVRDTIDQRVLAGHDENLSDRKNNH